MGSPTGSDVGSRTGFRTCALLLVRRHSGVATTFLICVFARCSTCVLPHDCALLRLLIATRSIPLYERSTSMNSSLQALSPRFAHFASDGQPHCIGILGGTFDPIHIGHLNIAQRALVEAHLDGVLFVPAFVSPFKTPGDATALEEGAARLYARQRLEMCKLATHHNPLFDVCSYEVDHACISYTVDTLAALHEYFGCSVRFVLILGSDAAAQLSAWKNPAALAQYATVLVFDRVDDCASYREHDAVRDAACNGEPCGEYDAARDGEPCGERDAARDVVSDGKRDGDCLERDRECDAASTTQAYNLHDAAPDAAPDAARNTPQGAAHATLLADTLDALSAQYGFTFQRVPSLRVSISSRVVRQQLQFGSARYLVPDNVYDYICEQGLYGISHNELSYVPSAQPAPNTQSVSAVQPTSGAQPTQPGQSAPFSLTENADYALSDEFFARAKQLLEKRVSPHRFTHCCSVARYSAHLAKLYHYPEKEARIAGLLHDWDKAYTNDDIRARALAFKTRIDGEVLDFLPALLHGPTGACALEADFPFLDGRILRAIERHTAGHEQMSDLDCIVYVADALEEGRSYPGIEDLRALPGTVSLQELFFETYKHVLLYLLQRNAQLHPRTVCVWNWYVRQRSKGELS